MDLGKFNVTVHVTEGQCGDGNSGSRGDGDGDIDGDCTGDRGDDGVTVSVMVSVTVSVTLTVPVTVAMTTWFLGKKLYHLCRWLA